MKRIFIIIFLYVLTFQGVLAGAKRPMRVSDLFRIRLADTPEISPDGRWVVYTISTPDWRRNKRVVHVYRVSFMGGDTLRLTAGDHSEWNPQWQPEGRLIGFLSDRSGSNQIWIMNPFHGEPGQMTEMKMGVQQWCWSNDGNRIAFTSRDSLTTAEERRRKAGNDARVIDQDLKRSHLYVLDLRTREVKRLTRGEYSVAQPVWSVDDRFLYFEKRPSDRADDRWRSDIYRVPSDSGAIRPVVATDNEEFHPLPSPDGEWIAFSRRPGPGRWIGNPRLALIPALGGRPREVATSFDGPIVPLYWTADSRTIFFSATTGVSTNLFRIDVISGVVSNVSGSEEVLRNFSFSEDGSRVAFILEKPDQPGEVYSAESENFVPRHLTFCNRWLEKIQFGHTEVIRWPSADGRIIEGILVTPPDFSPDHPVATIVKVHGGPSGVYRRSFLATWGNFAHILAGMGYATFMPNFRGSSGYGEEFLRADIQDWGRCDFQDIMSGIDYLIEKKIADPDRLGISGWSYGGYMTFWAVTQSTRFKAAVTGAGLTNIFSMYSENDIPSVLDAYFRAPPWKNPEEYHRASPMSYVKNVSTPLLIFQGERDARVPRFQAMEFYNALKKTGKKTRMVFFPRQGHGIHELKLQKRKVEEEIAWFNRYIRLQPGRPEGKTIDIERLITLSTVTLARISPDGKTVLFTKSQWNKERTKKISHIYRADLDQNCVVQLTRLEEGEFNPRWSPRGDRIAFLSEKKGKAQIFVMNPYHGEAGAVTRVKTGVVDFRWSPDGTQLAFTMTDTLSGEEEQRRKSGEDVIVWEVTEQKQHLWLVEIASGAITRLTDGNFNVLDFDWSPDGREIAFSYAPFRIAEETSKARVQVIDIRTRGLRRIFQDEIGLTHLRWSPDGSKLAAINHLGTEIGHMIRKPNILVVNRDGSGKINVTRQHPWDVVDFEWLADNSGFLVLANYGVRSQVYRLTLATGKLEPISHGDFFRRGLTVSSARTRMCYLAAGQDQLEEVYWSRIQPFTEHRISAVNSQLLGFELGKTEIHHWLGKDGKQIEGLVVKPPEFEKGLRYPTIVIPHGGPVGHYSLVFNPRAQLFAASGYLVLLPNVRGSSAYGEQFLRANRGDLGGGDFQDLMAGLDHLIGMGVADPERLGIWGWSYGGFLAARAITQTDRFKAAVVGAGVTNWFSLYGQDDIQYDVEGYFHGTPYENRELVENRSPIFSVKNVSTPVLLLHGEKDFRDPLPPAKNFYLALKKLGIPAKLVVYPREGHRIGEYNHLKDLLRRSLHWMDQYLFPETMPAVRSSSDG